ncbi:glycosyltransferase family 39 protein [Pedobacter africanus]|uniref:Dolichyl-phosphate-mannose-protein mannosyltransferase n=1 Tax=Pedobacter africanus TaxID=151894 RepID=A0A1W2DFW4_9SPHI|nr:glycosyltransferase family 39 protein [Pedobacter africanus]SMC96174.1 Dolichyl-phosphate-mannose-protein mannosyltransferase [Pedobacter africanus]
MNLISTKIFTDPINWKRLTTFFLITGCAIRLFHFFSDRSLWLDEVYLVSGLVHLDFKGLINGPLDYQQKAPVFFLILVKIVISLFGNKEIWLRLVPLISGLATLFLFVLVCRYFLNKPGSLVAIAVVCLSPAFIYHSVEIKQYATELFGSVLSLYLFVRYKDSLSVTRLLIWGFAAGLILWLSYSAVFILAGIAVALSIDSLLKKEWQAFFYRLIPFTIWLASFAVNYLLFTHKHADEDWVVYWFRFYQNFMPMPPQSFSDLKWFAVTFYRMLDYPLGLLWNWNVVLKMSIVPIALILLGSYKFIKSEMLNVLVLFCPLLFTLLASGLELYPLTERFWLFIAPVFLLIIGKGFDVVWTRIQYGFWKWIFFIVVVTGPASQAIASVLQPQNFYMHKKSYQKETLNYIDQHYQEGDAVYVYWNILPQFRLYKELHRYRFKAVEGRDFRSSSVDISSYKKHLVTDIARLRGKKRVWLILSHKFLADIGDRINEPSWYYKKEGNPTNIVVEEFLKLGRLNEKMVTTDVTVFLFTMK